TEVWCWFISTVLWGSLSANGRFIGFGTDAESARIAAIELNRIHSELKVDQAMALVNLRAKKDSKHTSATLKEWIERYSVVLQRRVERGEIRPRTRQGRMQDAKVLLARLPTSALTEISSMEISAILAEYIDDDKIRRAKGLRESWIDLYREAQYDGKVPHGCNPAEATRKPIAKVKRRRLSLDEWRQIYDMADAHYIKSAMLLALITGQRPGDIVNMKFTDIKDDLLYIKQSKTGAKIAIPLELRCVEIDMNLREAVAICRDRVLSKYLIHHTKTVAKIKAGDPVTVHSLGRKFAKARDLAGIAADDERELPTFYEQRSLSGRLYKAHGLDVQMLWGHKTEKMSELYLDDRADNWQVISL
ncbi:MULTISPECIES: tyrosine-type recombinase/integrase, partial [unclassified Klebsiella]